MITPKPNPFGSLPFFTYGGTITFSSDKDVHDKVRIIDKIPKLFSKLLPHNLQQPSKTQYYLTYSIEYHKVAGENDPEAPHVHFILYSHKKLPRYIMMKVEHNFKNMIGRFQFYILTTLKYHQYYDYIRKDIEDNNRIFQKEHFYEQYLTVELKQNYDPIDDDYTDNAY